MATPECVSRSAAADVPCSEAEGLLRTRAYKRGPVDRFAAAAASDPRLTAAIAGDVARPDPILLLVDEQPVVRLGIAQLLDRARAGYRLLDADTCEEAVALARRHSPEIVLLDPMLRDLRLAEAVRIIRATSPRSRIVLFAARLTPSLYDRAEQADIDGLLHKGVSLWGLLTALNAIEKGERFVEAGQGDALHRAAAKLNSPALTPREHEVFRRAARGESNREIATAVALAPATVKSYVQSALGKLQARNRAEAVFKLSELGLL